MTIMQVREYEKSTKMMLARMMHGHEEERMQAPESLFGGLCDDDFSKHAHHVQVPPLVMHGSLKVSR